MLVSGLTRPPKDLSYTSDRFSSTSPLESNMGVSLFCVVLCSVALSSSWKWPETELEDDSPYLLHDFARHHSTDSSFCWAENKAWNSLHRTDSMSTKAIPALIDGKCENANLAVPSSPLSTVCAAKTSSVVGGGTSMEASQEASASFGNRSHCDEVQWVLHVKRTLETMNEEAYSRGLVSIFGVPKSFLAVKPEAYIPQIVALGPYHHWDRQLYQMEHYKLAATKRTQNQLQLHGFTLQQIVDYCVLKEHAIRSCYHRHIDLHADTLAWMMAIDASFLLEFLRNFSCEMGPSMSQMTDLMGMKMACNSILRDVMMLENQIPLFLVRKMLCFQCSSSQAVEDELSMMLVRFLKAVSPFKATQSLARIVQVKRYDHLLQLLYCIIVANAKDMCSCSNNNNEIECVIDAPESNNEQNKDASQYAAQLFDSVWSSASALHIMNLLIVKPIEFLLKVPWPVVTAVFRGVRSSYNPIPGEPLLAEEIEIPSVTELIKTGVKFKATEGDLRTIEFDTKTATFYLPAMNFDANSEVVLRNLVAYETAAEPGPLVFTRYTELVNGIIDTKEDVRLLRRSGVVLHRMKNDEEVAKLWNGMSRSARPTKVDFLDKVISDVNDYYNSRWSVRTRRFIKNYVTGSWQVLSFLAAILLLLLTCVDAFCSVFRCGSLWSSLV